MLQHRYYLYQTTFPINEYGVWLEISYMKRFFVTAVYRGDYLFIYFNEEDMKHANTGLSSQRGQTKKCK